MVASIINAPSSTLSHHHLPILSGSDCGSCSVSASFPLSCSCLWKATSSHSNQPCSPHLMLEPWLGCLTSVSPSACTSFSTWTGRPAPHPAVFLAAPGSRLYNSSIPSAPAFAPAALPTCNVLTSSCTDSNSKVDSKSRFSPCALSSAFPHHTSFFWCGTLVCAPGARKQGFNLRDLGSHPSFNMCKKEGVWLSCVTFPALGFLICKMEINSVLSTGLL